MLRLLLLLCEAAAAAAAAVTFFLRSEAWYRTGVMRSIVTSVLCAGVGGVAGVRSIGLEKWKPIFKLLEEEKDEKRAACQMRSTTLFGGHSSAILCATTAIQGD